MPFWQFFQQGRNGHVLLVRPLRIPYRISKIIFALGADEFLVMLEGKIGECPFFRVQSGKMIVCRRLSFSLHQHTTVCWKVGRNLNGCGFSHYHQAKDGKKLCSMGHNKHLPNGLLACFCMKTLVGL